MDEQSELHRLRAALAEANAELLRKEAEIKLIRDVNQELRRRDRHALASAGVL